MVTARCHVLLTLAQRRPAWVRLRSLLSRGSVPAFQGHGRGMRALILRGVCKPWTSGHLPSTLGFMTSARIASTCFTRPRFELGLSSRAPLSPPNEFDCHASSSRGSLRSSIKMYSNVGLSTPQVSTSSFAPVVNMLDVSTTRSCMDSSRVVWHLHMSWRERDFIERFKTDR